MHLDNSNTRELVGANSIPTSSTAWGEILMILLFAHLHTKTLAAGVIKLI